MQQPGGSFGTALLAVALPAPVAVAFLPRRAVTAAPERALAEA